MSTETGRSRHEERTVDVFIAEGALGDPEWADLIAAIIRVRRRRLVYSAQTGLWRESSEAAFYVAEAMLPAATVAAAIRRHWGIENRSHYPRDVAMGEDASRVRKNPGVLARVRSFATNIMRANNVQNITGERFRNAIAGLDIISKYRLW